jgi:hypothetical protein
MEDLLRVEQLKSHQLLAFSVQNHFETFSNIDPGPKISHCHNPRLLKLFLAQLAILAMCIEYATGASPGTVVGVSTNTGNGQPTTLLDKSRTQLAISYRLPSTVFDYYLYLTYYDDNDASTQIRYYSIFGDLRHTFTAFSTRVKSVILKDPLKLFVIGGSGSSLASVYEVTVSGLVYTTTSKSSNSMGGYEPVLCSDGPESEIIYCLFVTSGDSSKHHRIRIAPLIINPTLTIWTYEFTASNIHNKLRNCIYMNFALSNSVQFFGNDDSFRVYNKADGTIVKDFEFQSSVTAYAYAVDNLDSNQIFRASGNYFARIYLSGLASAGTLAPGDLTQTNNDDYSDKTNNILNFGPYQYVVTIQRGITNLKLKVYSKTDLSTISTIALPITTVKSYDDRSTFSGGVPYLNRIYFAFIEDVKKNFQSYYLTMDACVTRGGDGICTLCEPGHYFTSLLTGNDCVLKSAFPRGFGADEPAKLMRACAPYCIDCYDDYSTCLWANGYAAPSWCFVHNPTDLCYTAITMPARFGGVQASGLTASCTDTNCLKCFANYQQCTACDTALDYFVDGTTNSCVLNSSLPNGKGPNLLTGYVASCVAPNCLVCTIDYLYCQTCNTAGSYYLKQDTKTCVYVTLIAAGTGANLTSGFIEPCTITQCTDCRVDYTGCSGCNTAGGYYLNTNDTTCVHVDDIPDYNGAKISDGTIELCIEPNCVQCNLNSQQCSLCDYLNDYYLEQSTYDCLLRTTLPDRKGPNLGTKVVLSCSDPACLDCRTNYIQCSACDTTNFYYLDTGVKNCLLVSTIPTRFGANLTSGFITGCQDTHCMACQADFLKCQTCDTGNLYYRDAATETCVQQSLIPTGNGADLDTGDIGPCTVANCVDCRANRSTCTGCDVGSNYYLKEADNACILKSAIPAGFGPDLTSGKVEACSVTNCADCGASHLVCIWCNLTASYYKNTTDGLCVFVSSIPTGQGANNTTGIFETCWTSNCKNCQSNSATCQVCDVINGFFKNTTDGLCQEKSTIADFYGSDINSGLILPCLDTHCKDCRDAHSQCDFCDVPNNYYFDSSTQTCILSWNIASGFGGKAIDGQIYACDSSGCTNCSTNFMECVTCDTSLTYYLDSIAHSCVLVNDIPPRYGADDGDGTIKNCQDINCLGCKNDFTICTSCDVPANYFLDPNAENCVLISSIPLGFGANSTTGILEICRPSNCNDCQTNSSECTTCNTAANYFLNTTSHLCILNSSIIDKYGPNRGTGFIQDCIDTNCLDCKYRHDECKGCDLANGFYLNKTDHYCVLNINIPDGSGVKAVDGSVSFCQDTPNCKKCQANYSICTACDVGNKYYLNTITKTCTYETSIVDFSGANLTSGNIDECKVSNCRKCQANNAVCSACDTLTLYFMRNSTGQCVYFNDIEDSHGADVVTGRIARCTDLNCLNCRESISQCQGCDMNNGYFLNTTLMGCVTLASVQLGYGGDLTSGIVVPCAILGCKDCRVDAHACTACDTAIHYYLNTSAGDCVLDSTLPDHFGPNVADGYIEECQTAGCRDCKTDSSQCSICMTSEGYYKSPANECILFSDIEDFKGADVTLGLIANCQLTDCKYCKKDSRVCTGCDTSLGLYLSVDKTSCTDVFPDGYGPDLEGGAVKACSDVNCKICNEDFASCILCDTSKSFYLDGSSCSPAAKAPKGMGLNKTTSLLDPCATEFCQNCSLDYEVCNSCYENMGYYLEGNLCVLMDAKLEIKESSSKPTGVSMSLYAGTNPTLSVDKKLLFADLRKQVEWTITFLKESTNKPESVEPKKAIGSSEMGVTLDLTVQSELAEKSYLVNVSFAKKYYNVTLGDGSLVRISGGRGQFKYQQTATLAEAKGAADSGAAVNSAMGGSISSSPAFLPVMMAVVALDPTGVLMKFNQILKIINKLYFININYGTRLDAFLKGMGEQQGNVSSAKAEWVTRHQTTHRGKLTNEKVSFDFLADMNYKVGLYLFVWLLTPVNYLLRAFDVRAPKALLHVMYWADKAHLIIFNLVFIDFIWYGGHTMLHAQGLPILEQILTFACLLLTAVDVALIVAHTASTRDWLYWILLRRKIDALVAEEKRAIHFEGVKKKKMDQKDKSKELEKKKIEQKKKVLKDKNHVESDEEDEDESKKKKQAKERPINYQHTYDEFNSNKHLYNIAAVNLAPLARVYLSVMARSLYMNHIFRTIVYQGVILACQFSSGMAIATLVLVESYRIGYSVYFYVKYKYLKNIICLLMEVMQSGLLLCFLVVAMIVHPKSFDEIILDFYQDAGIWIVIASCVAEYLLLLTYIGVAAYDFFKNRKSVNRAMDKLKLSYIKYGKEPIDLYKEKYPEEFGGARLAKINPLSAPAKVGSGVQIICHQDAANSSLVTLVVSNKQNNSQNNKGMPTVKTIIGKSKNKFNLAEHVRNKLEEKAKQKAEVVSKVDLEDKDLNSSTKGSVKKISSPIRSALKRVQNKPNLKLNPQISKLTFQKVSPVPETVELRDAPTPIVPSPVSKDQIAGLKGPTKLSSLLGLFNKKPAN